jgi:serine/threonine protein kinase
MPYVAPEVLKGKSYTKEADVYSFGMVMYFVATRKQPFNNCAHNQDLALKICDLGVRPEINETEVPRCYIDLMDKCWNSDPNNRPKIAEVVNLIKSFTNNEEFNKKEYNRKNINNDQSTHSQAIYTSRLLNPYTKNLSDDCTK